MGLVLYTTVTTKYRISMKNWCGVNCGLCQRMSLRMIFLVFLTVVVLIIISLIRGGLQPADCGLPYKDFPPEKMSVPPSSGGPRILCMVVTCPENYHSKAVHLAATWGSHCSSLVFLSDKLTTTDRPDHLNIEELPGVAGREDLWYKVRDGIVAVYHKYREEFDFLLKADDDT